MKRLKILLINGSKRKVCEMFVLSHVKKKILLPHFLRRVFNRHLAFSIRPKNMYVCSYPAVPAKMYQPCTFCGKNLQTIIEDLLCFFKVRDLHLLSHLMWSRWFNFLFKLFEYTTILFTRFCICYPYALCIEKKNNDKRKSIKNPTYLPTLICLSI